MRLGVLIAMSAAMLTACESSQRNAVEVEPLARDPELAAVYAWTASAQPGDFDSKALPDPVDVPSVATMLDGLERRLAESPDDLKGWSLLAASYAHVGRMDDARRAQDRAVELGADPLLLEQQILAAHAGSAR